MTSLNSYTYLVDYILGPLKYTSAHLSIEAKQNKCNQDGIPHSYIELQSENLKFKTITFIFFRFSSKRRIIKRRYKKRFYVRGSMKIKLWEFVKFSSCRKNVLQIWHTCRIHLNMP